MSDFGWKGEEIRLVPLDRERHLENCLAWMNDPEVTRWILRGDFPTARPAQEAWFAENSGENESRVVFAVETQDGEHVGITGLHAIEWRNRVAKTGTLLGARERWGRGLGTDVIRTRSRYAFEVLGLRLLLSEVMDGNVASLRALAKGGYVESGRIPKRHWKRGAWRDSVLLHLDAEAWRAEHAQ